MIGDRGITFKSTAGAGFDHSEMCIGGCNFPAFQGTH